MTLLGEKSVKNGQLYHNPKRGRQARNLTTNVPKILDLKSFSEQIFSKHCRCRVPLISAKQYEIAQYQCTYNAGYYKGISMTKFNNLKVKSVKSNLKYTESKLTKDHGKWKKY